MKITSYVAGFVFSADFEQVALIRKNKPEWQAGKLNGIGGKVEAGETTIAAMNREFAEEASGATQDFVGFATLGDGETFDVRFFAGVGEPDCLISSEDEKIEVVQVRDIHALREDMIENLPWLIALAIDKMQDGRPNDAVIQYPA